MRRVLALWLDGWERTLLLELTQGGEVPTLRRLVSEGAVVPLRTSTAYRSEYAATALLTGQHAERARYWSTVTFDPATYTTGTIGAARRTPFYAGLAPRQCVVFDAPHSTLVDGLPGAQVVGWGGHDARFSHPRASAPAGLMDEIDARFGTDPTSTVEYSGAWHQERYINSLADALVAAAQRRADIARWLQRRFPDWALFLMGLSEPHAAGHNFAHGLDPSHLLGSHPTAPLARQRFVEVLRAVDAAAGAVIEACPEGTTVAAMSQNGMQPNRDDVASSMLLPELLHRLAFGRPHAHEPAQRAWRRGGHRALWPDPAGATGVRSGKLRADGRLAPLKRRYHLAAPPGLLRTERQARAALGRGPSPAPSPTLPVRTPDGDVPVLAGSPDWSPTMWYRHRWPSMRWFALPTFSDGHIRLNVQGRERDGIVALDDYHRVCDDLERTLRRAVDPRSGEPLVDEVIRLRADAPMATDGPGADLVVTWRHPADALQHPEAGTVGPFAFPRAGSHTTHGFLVVAGPGIEPGERAERPLVDVPATLLGLLGEPVPPDFDGEPIDATLARSD